ncbi:hypothetical protein [Engelhardtia mirabilis]|uniref:Uncharacterized protein n=1 Tax=Engelhardtia mirabilis TaxID=2528011 RepID=A0A518BP51_9BACT|nr:hypothetical protein Pla133_38580 [Planctomycetes bacterium Pla133]QDV03082.1 hypothetical protein Pla86_38570 [Planctomycetes bacterium Pla86]
MRRLALILVAAALASCAAPGGFAEEDVCVGPPMTLDGPLTGWVVVAAPDAD